MFRKLATIAVAIATLAVAATPGAAKAISNFFTVGVITSPLAKVTVQGKRPSVQLAWTDTNTVAIVMVDIQRKTVGGTDTNWRRIGYNLGQIKSFSDPYVLFGKTYRYRVRDSIAATAWPAWSDSVSIAVVSH
jgi:hypothetical protein